MRALTLYQPYATLVIIGAKRYETRHWQTNYRGPLAIHAAKAFPDWAIYHTTIEPFRGVLHRAGILRWEDLPLGAVLGTVQLLDCQLTSEVPVERPSDEWYFGNYAPGRRAFSLGDPQPFDAPIAARGGQKVWIWTLPVGVAH